MSERRFGRILWFKDNKGYGFLRPDDTDEDIFFHWVGIDMEGFKTVKPDQRISFVIGENHKGPTATEIQIEQEYDLT